MKSTTYISCIRDAKTLLEECRTQGGCSEGIEWLRRQVHKYPNASLIQIRELLRSGDPPTYLNKAGKKITDISAIRSWEAWVCRYVLQVECSSGTYSGGRGVFSGPDVDDIQIG